MHLYREIDMLLKNYPKSINSYKELLSKMLQYINKNNVVLFNGEKINKIPDDIVLYKKDVILPSISSIDFKELLFTFNEIVKALSFENDNIRGISETGIIREFKRFYINIYFRIIHITWIILSK